METLKRNILASLLILSTIGLNAQNVGDAAPNFTVSTLSGTDFTLSEYSGKVVFIFFFGNNCPHCKSNAPNTQSGIYSLLKDNPDFVAIGIDTWDGSSSAVQSFKTITGVEYDMGLNGSSVASDYNTTYDRVLVIDKEGILRYKSSGYATTQTVSEAKTIIDEYLAKSVSQPTGLFNSKTNSNLYIYPNPVINNLNVSIPATQGNIELQVLSIIGTKIYTEQISTSNTPDVSISLEGLKNGYYIIHLSDGDNTWSSKFYKL